MLSKEIEYKVDRYYNKWSIIDTYQGYSLLENTTWGDETCYLVADNNVEVVNREYIKKGTGEKIIIPTITTIICETFDGIVIALKDAGIL